MAYIGSTVPVPLGQMGLFTDEPMSAIPMNAALVANNVTLGGSKVEKSRGSALYSETDLGEPIVAVHDWWPTPTQQRLIAATSDGQLWRDAGTGTWTAGVPIGLAGGATDLGILNPDVMFVEGGAEVTANSRKLFFFPGTRQIQVITADGIATTAIANPGADWAAGNYPTFGIQYQSRLVVFGVPTNPHRIYISAYNDHEQFTGSSTSDLSTTQTYNIFSGEGEALVGGYVYKGLLLLFKKPFGVYIFDWRDTTVAPTIQRLSDNFGLSSPHGLTGVLDDLIASTSTGSLTSLKATQAFGSLEQGDVLAQARIRNYIRDTFHANGTRWTHALYYPEKMMAYFTMRDSPHSTPEPFGRQNRMLVMDVSGQQPKFTIETKDQVNCLALRRDSAGISRPMYGANDGYVYLMDQPSRNVGGVAYISEFQTPHTDFSQLDQSLADKVKIFDFLTIAFSSTGLWPFHIDVYIDGKFSETLTYRQVLGPEVFVLDQSLLDVGILGDQLPTTTERKPLHGSGRTISFRIYNNNLNQYFRVERCSVSFRIGGERSTGL